MTPLNMLLVIIIVISLIYLIIYHVRPKQTTEHFTEEGKDDGKKEDVKYITRMNIMKVFDAIADRKPTPDEIDHFSNLSNTQDLVTEIYKKIKGVKDEVIGEEESATTIREEMTLQEEEESSPILSAVEDIVKGINAILKYYKQDASSYEIKKLA